VETDRYVPTVGGFSRQTLITTNPVAAWLDANVILDAAAETPVGIARRLTLSESDPVGKKTWSVYEHAADWLYPNYVQWCAETGHKEHSSKTFTPALRDLLCYQLKVPGIEKLDRSGDKLSRFKGIRLRTNSDDDTPSPLSPDYIHPYGKVRQVYGRSTAGSRESTNGTGESHNPSNFHSTAIATTSVPEVGGERRTVAC
jgi:hypothetical protein